MNRVYAYEADVLRVLFPDYRIVTVPGYLSGKVIFIGRDLVQGDEEAMVFSRVLNKDVSISIPDRMSAVAFAAQRKGAGHLQKSLEKYIEKLSREEFLVELNYFMATGKWVKVTDADTKVYELFKALSESKVEFLRVYFQLRKTTSFQVLWSSVLTFFLRVLSFDPESTAVSEYYKGVIIRFKNQSQKIRSVLQLVGSNHFDEATALSFLLEVR